MLVKLISKIKVDLVDQEFGLIVQLHLSLKFEKLEKNQEVPSCRTQLELRRSLVRAQGFMLDAKSYEITKFFLHLC